MWLARRFTPLLVRAYDATRRNNAKDAEEREVCWMDGVGSIRSIEGLSSNNPRDS